MHVSVLLKEAIEGLSIKKGDTVLDATFGGGGHAEEICDRIGKTGLLIGIDKDERALQNAQKILDKGTSPIHLENEDFRNLDKVLGGLKKKCVNAILFDLGLRTEQLTESGRGFSFRRDEPLIMTFGEKVGPEDLTAYKIVNAWSREDLRRILLDFGEERFAGRIAQGIIDARKESPIKTTEDLVEIIKKNTPAFYQRGRGHCARKTFQALRIAVNDELGALKEGLSNAFDAVCPGGKIAVISFHSLEDRIVKNFFRDKKMEGNFKIITKKPIVPSEEEAEGNPLARSAKLRIIEKNQ